MQNNIDIKNKKIVILILLFIILLQISIRIYAGKEKTGYHWDEPLSYSLMNYDAMHISDKQGFLENWNNGKEYCNDYYQVNKDEIWNWQPIYTNQANDVHPPIYYILLRCAASFTIDSYSKWTGIGLNIIISVASTIVIYFIAKELFKNKVWALLICFAVTTSITAVETTIFIRMYELVMLNFLLLTLWFVKNYDKTSLDIKSLILFVICLVTGFLTQYYYLIFAFELVLIMIIKLIRAKKTKECIKIIVASLVASVIAICLFPPCIKHLLYSNRGVEAAKNVGDFANIWEKIVKYLNLISDHTFNVSIIIINIALIIFFIIYIVKKIKIEKKIVLLSIVSAFYTIVIIKIAPYIEIRYVCAICSILIIIAIYWMKICLEAILRKEWAIGIGIIICLLVFSISLQRYDKTTYSFYNEKDLVEELKDKTILMINEGNEKFYITPEVYSILYESDKFYCMFDENFNQIEEVLQKIENEESLYVFLLPTINQCTYINKILNVNIYNKVDIAGNCRYFNVYKFN